MMTLTTVRGINKAVKDAAARGRNLYAKDLTGAAGLTNATWLRVFRAETHYNVRTGHKSVLVLSGYDAEFRRLSLSTIFEERV